MKFDAHSYKLTDAGSLKGMLLGIGIVGLAASVGGFFVNKQQFFFSYLTAVAFWTTIGLGGLFFVLVHHLTNARWSTVLRRFVESIMATLPWMLILALPILTIGLPILYSWASPATDPELAHLLHTKAPWLNAGFFRLRAVIYFAIWGGLAFVLYRQSIAQDSGHRNRQYEVMKNTSGPGMVLFALSITFFAIDFLMSLDFKFFSTIFGVYIFASSFVAFLAFTIFSLNYLRTQGVLAETVNTEHYHDLGKLLFGFIVFWTYIAFSQYFLIWYGNMPEETEFFLNRWVGSWKTMSMVLLFGQFVVPFLVLMSRIIKRIPALLAIVAAYMLVMHFVNLHWIVMPALYPEGVHLSWMDLTTVIGVGGIFTWRLWSIYSAHALVPVNDPMLSESLTYENTLP
jgi:hypothetical protein